MATTTSVANTHATQASVVHTTPPSWVWKTIPPAGLKALDKYKYTGEDLSILVRLFLRDFWNACMAFIPQSIAPNLITIIGFSFLLSNHILSLLWCQGEAGETCRIPPVYFLWFAFSVFIYQVMDNLDGKQARRTGSSSALGELFDHGCDSLYMCLIAYPVACSIGWSGTETLYVLTAAVTVFYASHWEEYHTNALVLGQFCNPTEGQIGCMLLFIFAYFVGPQWWATHTLGGFFTFLPPSIAPISLRVAGLYGLPFLLFYVIADNLNKWCKTNKQNFLGTFSKLSPLLIHILLMHGWVHYSKINIAETQFVYLVHFHAIMFSYLCDKLMIARITQQPVSGWNNMLFLTLIGALNAYFGPFIPESLMLPALTYILIAIFIYFVVSVTMQLSHYLDIFVFRLGKPKHHNVK